MTGTCSRCHEPRTDDELNGIEILADNDQERYRAAYCRELAICNSVEAKREITRLRFGRYVDWDALARG
jgi:hypothetical protein